jgi:hypothetical protein
MVTIIFILLAMAGAFTFGFVIATCIVVRRSEIQMRRMRECLTESGVLE